MALPRPNISPLFYLAYAAGFLAMCFGLVYVDRLVRDPGIRWTTPVIVSPFVLGFAFFVYRRETRLVRDGVDVRGKVIDLTPPRSGLCEVTFAYEFKNAEFSKTKRIHKDAASKLKANGPLDLLVNPERPDQFMILVEHKSCRDANGQRRKR